MEEKEVFFGGAASWRERGGDGVGVEVEGPGGGALKGGNNLLAVRLGLVRPSTSWQT